MPVLASMPNTAEKQRDGKRRRYSTGDTFVVFAIVLTSAIATWISALNPAMRDSSFMFKAYDALGTHLYGSSPSVSRFHVRWKRVPIMRGPTLMESGNRVLYSQIAAASTDGLGHAFATFNVEVHTALQLRLTYSHRFASFGSITKGRPHAFEDAFGLGHGEIPRARIQKELCHMDEKLVDGSPHLERKPRQCQVCEKVHTPPDSQNFLSIDGFVHIPKSRQSTMYGVCLGDTEENCTKKLSHLRLDRNDTLYILPREGCDSLVAFSDFSQTAPWFQAKYWHHQEVTALENALDLNKNGSRNYRVLSLNDSELSIAVHIRRGDFLRRNSKRQATPSSVFINVIKSAVAIVRQNDDKLSQLPVAVHLYSEGRYKNGFQGGHVLSTMTQDYTDVDGTTQDTHWWQKHLSSDGPENFRVHMHVSEDTLSSIHDMASADIFIGSKSGLGENIIRSISRGVILLPCPQVSLQDRSRESCFGAASGRISKNAFPSHWQAYAEDFQSMVVLPPSFRRPSSPLRGSPRRRLVP